MKAFDERPSSLGLGHADYRCAVKGCPWHKVISTPPGNPDRVLADLREHARSHRGAAS